GQVEGGFDEYAAVRSRRGLATVLILLIMGGAAAGLYTQRGRLPTLFGHRTAAGEELLRMGREAFLLDTDEGYVQADHELQRAQAGPTRAQAVAALAEGYSTWALYLREDARLLEEQTGRGVSAVAVQARAQAADKRRDADQKLAQAKLDATEAIAQAPDDPDVNRAYSLYLVISGAKHEE